MNLLEQAMRQKTLRESSGKKQGDNSSVNAGSTQQLTAHPISIRLMIAGGVGIALIAGTIGILLDSPKNMPRPPSPGRTSIAPTTTEQTPVAETKSNDRQQQIKDFVDSWAKAWSEKDVANYLFAYAPEFKPAQGLSRAVWEKQRRQRLVKYKKIEIGVSNLTVSIKKESAVVEFTQSFRGDDFSETGIRKRLDIRRRDSRWMITKETSYPDKKK